MRRVSLLFALMFAPMSVLAQPASAPADKAPSKVKPSQPKDKPQSEPAAKPLTKATTPEFHDGTEKRHERFNAISKEGKAKLVFLGDSITEGWEGGGKQVWEQHYANRNAANFGVSGDRTEHVLWRLDHGNFDGLSPKLIVIMIGTNNTGHRQDPAADTAAGVRAILDRLQTKCPDAKVLLLAVFPRGEKADDKMRQINNDVNTRIAKFADDKRVFYKDVASVFLDKEGTLSKDLMPDFLHPNAKGYTLWADAIEADIAKLLGEPKADPKKDPKKDPKTDGKPVAMHRLTKSVVYAA